MFAPMRDPNQKPVEIKPFTKLTLPVIRPRAALDRQRQKPLSCRSHKMKMLRKKWLQLITKILLKDALRDCLEANSLKGAP